MLQCVVTCVCMPPACRYGLWLAKSVPLQVVVEEAATSMPAPRKLFSVSQHVPRATLSPPRGTTYSLAMLLTCNIVPNSTGAGNTGRGYAPAWSLPHNVGRTLDGMLLAGCKRRATCKCPQSLAWQAACHGPRARRVGRWHRQCPCQKSEAASRATCANSLNTHQLTPGGTTRHSLRSVAASRQSLQGSRQ